MGLECRIVLMPAIKKPIFHMPRATGQCSRQGEVSATKKVKTESLRSLKCSLPIRSAVSTHVFSLILLVALIHKYKYTEVKLEDPHLYCLSIIKHGSRLNNGHFIFVRPFVACLSPMDTLRPQNKKLGSHHISENPQNILYAVISPTLFLNLKRRILLMDHEL